MNTRFTRFIVCPGNTSVMVVICFVITTMIMEASIPDISVFAGEVIPSSSDITIFTIMTLIYAFGQFVILRLVKQTGQSVKSLMLRLVHTSVSVIQLFLILILLFIIVQMVIFTRYDILFMKLVIWVSCITSILLLGILAGKFLSWFRSNRNLTVFLYSLAIVLLSINAAFIILDITSSLTRFGQYDYIQPSIGKVASLALFSIDDMFHFGYVITSILSFIMMWLATVVLLHYHSTKLGRIKYWIVVTIPLVYFLSEFQSYFIDLLTQFRLSDPILYLTVYPGECSTGAIPEDGPSKSPSSITPTDLLKCAKDSNMVIKLMKVKVDGQDVSSHIIRQSTSQPFKFFIPPENAVAYKTPPSGGNNTSMAENYYLFFKPLPVGQHTIELEVIRVPTVSTQPVEHPIAKWDINVVP